MAKLPEGRSTMTDEQMIGLTHRLVDTCIDCKARIEELEAKLEKAMELANLVVEFSDRALWKVVKEVVLELKGEK